MSVLNEICDKKRAYVKHKKEKRLLSELLKDIDHLPTHTRPSFIDAIKNNKKTAIIAEIKKASPSKGIIRKNFDPVMIAETYKKYGATCLSVLTDEPYFQGHDKYFKSIRGSNDLPMLRKDFMIDPYQIYESKALGADCILLIMAALNDTSAQELYSLSTELNMDVLIEVHDEKELERALKLSPKMLGINNRNLKTLDVDTNTALNLAKNLPQEIIKVAESGISEKETIDRYIQAGFDAFLIGESLMKHDDIAAKLTSLL